MGLGCLPSLSSYATAILPVETLDSVKLFALSNAILVTSVFGMSTPSDIVIFCYRLSVLPTSQP